MHPWVKLGCSEGLYWHLRSMDSDYGKCPIGRYRAHKRNAAERGIGFDLTLTEWWEIWDKSGHYPERGVRRGQYNMARNYDRGSYTVGNVQIVTVFENAITRRIVGNARRVRGPGRGGRGYRLIKTPESPFKEIEELVRDNA